MKRRTLDVIFSVGGVLVAVVLLVLALVLRSNERFSKDYVKRELTAQQITMPDSKALTAQGVNPIIANSTCLNAYAGQPMTTGKQAECYANNYIAVHLADSAKSGGYAGLTYATLGTPQGELRTQVAAATKANDPKLADLQVKFTAINNLRDTMFKGETLRGLLLTSYGFGVFGDKAAQSADVLFIGFVLMLVLSAAGFVHYFAAARRTVEEREHSGSLSPTHV